VPTATVSPSAEAGPLEVTWTPIAGPEPNAFVDGVSHVDGRWFAVGTVFGRPSIWFSDDGSSWTRAEVATLDEPNQGASVSDLVALGDTLVAIGSWSGAPPAPPVGWATWTSTDGGATWSELRDGPDPMPLRAVVAGGPGLVGAGWSFPGALPVESWLAVTSDGFTWERLTITFPDADIHAMAALGDRFVAAGTVIAADGGQDAAAWYSDDDGASWTLADVPGGDDFMDTIVAMVPFDGGLVAIGGGRSVAWVTADGATWQRFVLADGHVALGLAAVDGGLVAVGNVAPDGQGLGVGMSWTSVDGREWIAGPELGDGSVVLVGAAGAGTTVVAGGQCTTDACDTVLWLGEVSR
jgi:hypothetical protein